MKDQLLSGERARIKTDCSDDEILVAGEHLHLEVSELVVDRVQLVHYCSQILVFLLGRLTSVSWLP